MVVGDCIRRNILSVSEDERLRLKTAILELQKKKHKGAREDIPPGGVSYWFKQDEIHQATHVHRGPEFLPWHRDMLNRFEQHIREIDSGLSLHYWDWNTDPHDVIFTKDFMGNSNGDAGEPWLGKIYDPHANPYRGDTATDPINNNPSDFPRTLNRNLQSGKPVINLPGTPETLVQWPNDDDILSALKYATMRDLLEQAHDSAHGYIGGTIRDPHTSFRDPFVFLLHSNVDRLFARWQTDPAYPERLDPATVYGNESDIDSAPFCKTNEDKIMYQNLNHQIDPWSTGHSISHDLSTPFDCKEHFTRPWSEPNMGEPHTYKDPSIVTPPLYDTNHYRLYSLSKKLEAKNIPRPVSIRDLALSLGLTPPISVVKLCCKLTLLE